MLGGRLLGCALRPTEPSRGLPDNLPWSWKEPAAVRTAGADWPLPGRSRRTACLFRSRRHVRPEVGGPRGGRPWRLGKGRFECWGSRGGGACP